MREELVVTKRLVAKEEVVVRKRVVTEARVVEADLRRERIVVDERTTPPPA
jgi:stress response protein YsnF